MATKKSEKPILLTGSFYVRDKFVSKALVQAALEAIGNTVLHKMPKDDSDVRLLVGRVLGKQKHTKLEAAAKARGFDILEAHNLVTPRFNTALAKTLRSSSKLLASEKQLLEMLDEKRPAKKKSA